VRKRSSKRRFSFSPSDAEDKAKVAQRSVDEITFLMANLRPSESQSLFTIQPPKGVDCVLSPRREHLSLSFENNMNMSFARQQVVDNYMGPAGSFVQDESPIPTPPKVPSAPKKKRTLEPGAAGETKLSISPRRLFKRVKRSLLPELDQL
jgi:hypothetical protein